MNFPIVVAFIGLAYALFASPKKAGAKQLSGPPDSPSRKGTPSKRDGASVVGNYNPDAAQALSQTLYADLSERGRSVDKELLRAFQGAAGIAADGKYGKETKGALNYWLYASLGDGAPGAPDPHYGSGETIYSAPDGIARTNIEVPSEQSGWPPVSGFDENAAIFYAPLAAEAVRSGKSYRTNPNKVKAVRALQLASGLRVDGLYGPSTRGAVVYWLSQQSVYAGTAPRSLYGLGTTTYNPGGL